MLEIKVAGSGCTSCNVLEARVKKVLEELRIEAMLMKVSDFNEMARLGILVTPGLIINGEVVSQGKLPSESTLKDWLERSESR